jgi:CheY-like chemotaxis protein
MGPPQFQQNEKTDNVARLVVRDNGPGMTLEVQKRIFDPFFTTKEPGQGTGLGLAVCHGIVGEHDGHIWVKSEIGQGTSFFLEFPAATAVSLPTPSPSPAPAPPSPHHLPRILVVDDEESILRVISRILGERYEVDTVTNGRVALEKVEEEQYDLIICDVHMPGLNGIDFYETWRRRRPAQAQAVPILFITGDTVNHQTREKLASIAAPALAKPFAADALLAQTHALIAGAKRRKRS